MSASSEQALAQAYDLIEKEQLTEARDILKPLLSTDSSNPDVWWLYAHAVDDPELAHSALKHVLSLDPAYPDASELADKVGLYGEKRTTNIRSLKMPSSAVDDSKNEIDFDKSDFELDDDFDEDDFDAADEDISDSKRRFPLGFLALMLILAIIVIGVLIVLNPSRGQSTAVATSGNTANINTPNSAATANAEMALTTEEVIVEATDSEMVTETSIPAETNETNEPEPTMGFAITNNAQPTDDEFNSLKSLLIQAGVVSEKIEYSQTSLGTIIVVSVCSADKTTENNFALETTMTSLAPIANNLSIAVDGIGVSISDCENQTPPRLIIAPIKAVTDFESGLIDIKEFQRLWQPLS